MNDSLSAMRFCGLNLEDPIPDHSTLSRFCSELISNKGIDKLLLTFNKQLEKQQVIIRTGLKPLLDKIPKRHKKQGIYGDKGYKVPANDELLKIITSRIA